MIGTQLKFAGLRLPAEVTMQTEGGNAACSSVTRLSAGPMLRMRYGSYKRAGSSMKSKKTGRTSRLVTSLVSTVPCGPQKPRQAAKGLIPKTYSATPRCRCRSGIDQRRLSPAKPSILRFAVSPRCPSGLLVMKKTATLSFTASQKVRKVLGMAFPQRKTTHEFESAGT